MEFLHKARGWLLDINILMPHGSISHWALDSGLWMWAWMLVIYLAIGIALKLGLVEILLWPLILKQKYERIMPTIRAAVKPGYNHWPLRIEPTPNFRHVTED